MNFRSDNESPVNANIMEAIIAANNGFEESYGYDSYTDKLQLEMQSLFGCWCDVIPLTTGTSANSLAMALSTPSYGSLLCYETAHMMTDECGAPEFYSGGAKLIGINGQNGKIDIKQLDKYLTGVGVHGEHESLVSTVSLTQSTEAGTLYSIGELKQIKAIKEKYGLTLHMDGSRIANAVAATACDIAQMTWKSGVDLLSFGATKNGAMMAEALIIFNPKMGKESKRLRKRAGQLVSKMRFVSAQFLAYLQDDLWLGLASHANKQAHSLYRALHSTHEFIYPVQANEVFLRLNPKEIIKLRQLGFEFHVWPGSDDIIRLVFSHATESKHVTQLIEALKKP
jgi:threonine aldolase